VVSEQALDDDVGPRRQVSGGLEGAEFVIVDRLEDRLIVAQQLQVLLENVDLVAVGMQCRDASFRALGARIDVVIVRTDRQDLVIPADRMRSRVRGCQAWSACLRQVVWS
jgi:hypothetical protein